MKKNLVLFIYLLLLCIGLQYETYSYTSGYLSGTEYGIVGLSIFLALFYIVPALLVLYYLAKSWNTPKRAVTLALLGGLFLAGWTASYLNTLIHDLISNLFPNSGFWNTFESAIVAPLVEEPLKLLPIGFTLYLLPTKNVKSLLLLGVASGLGFQIVEDFSYILSDLPDGFSFTVSGILSRMTDSMASHWIYTSLVAVGLAVFLKAGKEFKRKGLFFFLSAFVLHFIRNTPFSELETDIPFTGPIISALTIFSFYLLYRFIFEQEKEITLS
ncbi:hypothetical protein STRDD10_00637 [Streptococcus sp. DD10]|uniref:PrsW family glutamic-type intramembrane protease n=1 Tax=Streptococcus sp. DD10 TaxID=1777878 RepID=UPI000793FF77|nr:PrsW family glutamic-type intramembrane protease [Streptococcus sp. DD10]KXT74857.1 hypothetical protein STRDD10_00637 [Streptococcus sp. DD10]